jgi:hypothetical protein
MENAAGTRPFGEWRRGRFGVGRMEEGSELGKCVQFLVF